MSNLSIEFSIENKDELMDKMKKLEKLEEEINSLEIKISSKPLQSVDLVQENTH